MQVDKAQASLRESTTVCTHFLPGLTRVSIPLCAPISPIPGPLPCPGWLALSSTCVYSAPRRRVVLICKIDLLKFFQTKNTPTSHRAERELLRWQQRFQAGVYTAPVVPGQVNGGLSFPAAMANEIIKIRDPTAQHDFAPLMPALIAELAEFCQTLLGSVIRRFSPYRPMFRVYALIDPTHRPNPHSEAYQADFAKACEMACEYWGLDGDRVLTQMTDFRAQYKPEANCDDGETYMTKKECNLCESNITEWYETAQREAWGARFPDYVAFAKVGTYKPTPTPYVHEHRATAELVVTLIDPCTRPTPCPRGARSRMHAATVTACSGAGGECLPTRGTTLAEQTSQAAESIPDNRGAR